MKLKESNLGEQLAKNEEDPYDPLIIVKAHYHALSVEGVEQTLSEASRTDNTASVRSLLEHWQGEYLPEALDKIIDIITRQSDDAWTHNHQEASLYLLPKNSLSPEQEERLTVGLATSGYLSKQAKTYIQKFLIENKEWQFPVDQLPSIVARVHDAVILKQIIERQHDQLEPVDIDHLLSYASNLKQASLADERWYRLDAADPWESKSTNKLFLNQELQKRKDRFCDRAYELFLNVIEHCDQVLQKEQIKICLKEDGYNNCLSEALVIHRLDELQKTDREEIAQRLGIYSLLSVLSQHNLAEPKWTDELLKQEIAHIEDGGYMFARRFDSTWTYHISDQHINRLIDKECWDVLLLIQKNQGDKFSKKHKEILESKLGSSKEARLAVLEFDRELLSSTQPDWRNEHNVMVSTIEPQIAAAGEPQLADTRKKMLLEYYGYILIAGSKEVENIAQYGHLFSSQTLNELIDHGSDQALLSFMNLYPDRFEDTHKQRAFRRYAASTYSTWGSEKTGIQTVIGSCLKQLDYCDNEFLINQGSTPAAVAVMSQRPEIFTKRRLLTLQKRGLLNEILPLSVALIKDWSPSKIESFLDLIQRVASVSSTRESRLEEACCRHFIAKTHNRLQPEQIDRLLEYDRNGVIAKAILSQYGSTLSSKNYRSAINKAGQLFQKRFNYVDHGHTYSY